MGEHKLKKSHPQFFPFTKSSFTVWFVVLTVSGIVLFDAYLRQRHSPMSNFDPLRTKGLKEAKFQIVEFADFQCHECSRGHALLKTYIEQHPSDIRLTMKYFPLGKINSTISAVHAQCAARQKKFWEFADELFSRQKEWQSHPNVKPYFLNLARNLGLEEGAFSSCVEDLSVVSAIQAERLMGESNAVRSTPTYFINKEMVVGMESLQEFFNKAFEN